MNNIQEITSCAADIGNTGIANRKGSGMPSNAAFHIGMIRKSLGVNELQNGAENLRLSIKSGKVTESLHLKQLQGGFEAVAPVWNFKS